MGDLMGAKVLLDRRGEEQKLLEGEQRWAEGSRDQCKAEEGTSKLTYFSHSPRSPSRTKQLIQHWRQPRTIWQGERHRGRFVPLLSRRFIVSFHLGVTFRYLNSAFRFNVRFYISFVQFVRGATLTSGNAAKAFDFQLFKMQQVRPVEAKSQRKNKSTNTNAGFHICYSELAVSQFCLLPFTVL